MIEAQNELVRARNRDDQERAQARQTEAMRQRNLLLRIDTASEESDFYPYRYLASEGFLPGYNFPALPVRAWVPRFNGGEFISRCRRRMTAIYSRRSLRPSSLRLRTVEIRTRSERES